MRYYFEWDHKKATENLKKHKVSFERATSIFLDSRAITIFDEEHSKGEDRWVTMGIDKRGALLVVIHTFQQKNNEEYKIRIISARKATTKETKQYMEENI
ncbi:MAG TPA: BrnT family toxin [Candidatus Brocadiia bacterium]|nr:BrnT family toxin [Candidatus Brocadiales bacterium]